MATGRPSDHAHGFAAACRCRCAAPFEAHLEAQLLAAGLLLGRHEPVHAAQVQRADGRGHGGQRGRRGGGEGRRVRHRQHLQAGEGRGTQAGRSWHKNACVYVCICVCGGGGVCIGGGGRMHAAGRRACGLLRPPMHACMHLLVPQPAEAAPLRRGAYGCLSARQARGGQPRPSTLPCTACVGIWKGATRHAPPIHPPTHALLAERSLSGASLSTSHAGARAPCPRSP